MTLSTLNYENARPIHANGSMRNPMNFLKGGEYDKQVLSRQCVDVALYRALLILHKCNGSIKTLVGYCCGYNKDVEIIKTYY